MNAILVLVPPEVCERIANGKQTLLLMKRIPKLETPYKVYMYCTGGTGKELVKDILYRWNGTRLIKRRVDKGWLKDNPKQTWQILLDYGFTHQIHSGDYELNGKVIGEFVCDKIWKIEFHDNWGRKEYRTINGVFGESLFYGDCGLTFSDIDVYLQKKTGFGLHISDLTIYDQPKELGEFGRYKKGIRYHKCEKWNEDCRYYEYEDDARDQGYCISHKDLCPLTRPPQSWCYVEEID